MQLGITKIMLMMNQVLGFGAGGVPSVNWALWTGAVDGTRTQLSTDDISSCVAAIKVDTDKVLSVWQRATGGGSYNLTAVISTVAGLVISSGSVVIVDTDVAASLAGLGLCLLDSSRAIVIYPDIGGNNIYGRVLSVSGTTITLGARVAAINDTSVTRPSVCKIDTDKLVFSWKKSSGGNRAKVLTVSGTTITTTATPFTYDANESSGGIHLAPLDTSRVFATYMNTAGNALRGIVISISSLTITAPTAVATIDANGRPGAAGELGGAVVISPDLAVLSYAAVTTGYGRAMAVSISGTVITTGTPIAFTAAPVTYDTSGNYHSCALNSTQVMVTYLRSSDSYGTATVLTATGTTLSFATAVVVQSANTSGKGTPVKLDDNSVFWLSGYNDGSFRPYGKVLKQV
jgi:hypothetical protein